MGCRHRVAAGDCKTNSFYWGLWNGGFPGAHKLIYPIWDLWRLTEHKTAGGTDILLNEEKAVPDVDTELLEHLVGNVK